MDWKPLTKTRIFFDGFLEGIWAVTRLDDTGKLFQ